MLPYFAHTNNSYARMGENGQGSRKETSHTAIMSNNKFEEKPA